MTVKPIEWGEIENGVIVKSKPIKYNGKEKLSFFIIIMKDEPDGIVRYNLNDCNGEKMYINTHEDLNKAKEEAQERLTNWLKELIIT